MGGACRRPFYFITSCPFGKKGRDIIGKEKKKMGRPISGDEPKDKRISLRATNTTIKKFNECSEKLKLSKTDLLENMVENLHSELYEKEQ